MVMIDSCILQEETMSLWINSMALRNNTDLAISISEDNNKVVLAKPKIIEFEVLYALSCVRNTGKLLVLWTGKTG
ncbi:hypothetical protein [Marinobacterium aestuariivivens]|uniref:PIN domain-containing protein n=1 Tax=Marinobacterium aestuariivivens TaxID=1698799 RepID=A0ABW1ZX02_9GAMM